MTNTLFAQTTQSLQEGLLIGVAKALIPVVLLAMVAFGKKSFRNWFLYRRTEYDLPYINGQGATKWTIQWEGYSIDIKATDVHNNKMDDVVVTERNSAQTKSLGTVTPKDDFEPLFNGLEFKLNTICRAIPANGTQTYLLRFVLRRRG